jgi:hypothetical protein
LRLGPETNEAIRRNPLLGMRGSGLEFRLYLPDGVTPRYGIIPKCPHCERTNIVRVHASMLTCGYERCKEKQNQLTKKRYLDKKKRQLEKLAIQAGD